MEIFQSSNFLLLLFLLLFLGEVFLVVLFFRSSKQTRKIFGAANGAKVMDMLAQVLEKSENTDKKIQDLFSENKKNRKVLQKSLHKVSLIRFNPFDDMGGDQSFCIALLDADNSGIIFTSLHSKQGIRTYARKIIEGKSNQPLGDEEQHALTEAIRRK